MNGRADDLYGLYGTDAYEDDGSDQPFFEGRALKMEQLYRLQQSEFYDSLDPSTFDVIPRIPLDRYGSCARAIGLLDINLWGRSTQDSASDIPTAVEEVSEQDMIDVDTEMGLVDEF